MPGRSDAMEDHQNIKNMLQVVIERLASLEHGLKAVQHAQCVSAQQQAMTSGQLHVDGELFGYPAAKVNFLECRSGLCDLVFMRVDTDAPSGRMWEDHPSPEVVLSNSKSDDVTLQEFRAFLRRAVTAQQLETAKEMVATAISKNETCELDPTVLGRDDVSAKCMMHEWFRTFMRRKHRFLEVFDLGGWGEVIMVIRCGDRLERVFPHLQAVLNTLGFPAADVRCIDVVTFAPVACDYPEDIVGKVLAMTEVRDCNVDVCRREKLTKDWLRDHGVVKDARMWRPLRDALDIMKLADKLVDDPLFNAVRLLDASIPRQRTVR